MTRRKPDMELIDEIRPDQIYRTTLSPAIFGYGPEATRTKIRNGELPPPFPLSPSSRFEAWTGTQVLEHRARMQALATAKAAEKRPQPHQLYKPRVRKIKLRPPSSTKHQKQRKSA